MLDGEQVAILVILAGTLAMFLAGRWRHDVVALAALMACVATGLVEPSEAFLGFGHPAVITVAAVLVLSHGLQTSGAIDYVARLAVPSDGGPLLSLATLVGIGAFISGGMNNVGAMALLMPVAIQIARRHALAPGLVLMPLAFGTILGGMTTLIGTPPNLIVSAFRDGSGQGPFRMFDYTPVGLTVAVAGVLFIVLFGRKLVPARQVQGAEEFSTGAYLTEVRVPPDSEAVDQTLQELEQALEDADAQVIGLVRNKVHLHAPHRARRIAADDILMIEADVEELASVLSKLGLRLVEEQAEGTHAERTTEGPDDPDKDDERAGRDVRLRELVVRPGSSVIGRTASDLRLRTLHGLNMLAISRHGARMRARLREVPLRPGDLLLMQGPEPAILDFAAEAQLVPLAERRIRLPDARKAGISALIMIAAIAVAALGLLPAAASFAGAVLLSMLLQTVPPREVYDAVDWPVIVLLGALLPVAGAVEATGAASLLGQSILGVLAGGNATVALALVLTLTMFLSDLMNNAATAAVMCPIAAGVAAALGVHSDSFLMAVAIGASCAFLTPIGHQNNTLILGPGGFRFGDYWRLGLPLEAIVVAVSIPMLLIVWPLSP